VALLLGQLAQDADGLIPAGLVAGEALFRRAALSPPRRLRLARSSIRPILR
jgi:hypothetical protein